eukprot:scaffold28537_cov33-Tisochrysis_lutea.AAC.5
MIQYSSNPMCFYSYWMPPALQVDFHDNGAILVGVHPHHKCDDPIIASHHHPLILIVFVVAQMATLGSDVRCSDTTDKGQRIGVVNSEGEGPPPRH